MLSDFLLVLALVLLVAAAYTWCLGAALLSAAVAVALVGVALSDGDGLPWRS